MNIDEQIKIERESLDVSIMPSERREHADKLAKLELKRAAESRCAMFDLWRSKDEAFREAPYFMEPTELPEVKK
jgi:hypothetical protein